jgi:hypothetical protein
MAPSLVLRDRHAVTVSAASSVIRIALSEGQTRRRPSAAPRRQTDYAAVNTPPPPAPRHPHDPIPPECAAAGVSIYREHWASSKTGSGYTNGARLGPTDRCAAGECPNQMTAQPGALVVATAAGGD